MPSSSAVMVSISTTPVKSRDELRPRRFLSRGRNGYNGIYMGCRAGYLEPSLVTINKDCTLNRQLDTPGEKVWFWIVGVCLIHSQIISVLFDNERWLAVEYRCSAIIGDDSQLVMVNPGNWVAINCGAVLSKSDFEYLDMLVTTFMSKTRSNHGNH